MEDKECGWRFCLIWFMILTKKRPYKDSNRNQGLSLSQAESSEETDLSEVKLRIFSMQWELNDYLKGQLEKISENITGIQGFDKPGRFFLIVYLLVLGFDLYWWLSRLDKHGRASKRNCETLKFLEILKNNMLEILLVPTIYSKLSVDFKGKDLFVSVLWKQALKELLLVLQISVLTPFINCYWDTLISVIRQSYQ